jgi:hypothetical protein
VKGKGVMAYCEECGADIGEAGFCSVCGSQSGSTEMSSETKQVSFEPVSTSVTTTDINKKKRSKKPVTFIIGAAVVIALVAVVFILINPFGGLTDTNERGESLRLEEPAVGDIVLLGEFGFEANAFDYGTTEHRDDFAWRVLDIQEGRALLISKDIIDLRQYCNEYTDNLWENSSIREWLNTDFYNSLPESARNRIVETTVINDNNPDFGNPGGNNTTDRIFLLSIDEARRYFSSDSDRQAGINLTEKAIEGFKDKYGYEIEEWARNSGGYYWLLRSPGFGNGYVAGVFGDGNVLAAGILINDYGSGMRPAFWINL